MANSPDILPYYAVPPGETLRELMRAQGVGIVQLQYRMTPSYQEIEAIIAGDAPVTAEIAVLLERATGVPQAMWNNLERNYRAQLAKEKP